MHCVDAFTQFHSNHEIKQSSGIFLHPIVLQIYVHYKLYDCIGSDIAVLVPVHTSATWDPTCVAPKSRDMRNYIE